MYPQQDLYVVLTTVGALTQQTVFVNILQILHIKRILSEGHFDWNSIWYSGYYKKKWWICSSRCNMEFNMQCTMRRWINWRWVIWNAFFENRRKTNTATNKGSWNCTFHLLFVPKLLYQPLFYNAEAIDLILTSFFNEYSTGQNIKLR